MQTEKEILPAPPDAGGEGCGFTINSVCWGYRDIFARLLKELHDSGSLGEENRGVTERFYRMLQRADQSCFDHVLRQFIGAFHGNNRWIMELPGVFSDVCDIGVSLAESRIYYGIRYFEILSRGGFGDSPSEVRNCLTCVRKLREVDDELAMAMLHGYRQMISRMTLREIDRYIDVGIEIFNRRRESGMAFMRGELQSSEAYIMQITRECRLSDITDNLRALFMALGGVDVEVADLGSLDSDDLIEHGTQMLCLNNHFYGPARFRHFDSSAMNRKWYLLAGIVGAAMIACDGFPRVHGREGFGTCSDLTGDGQESVNLFVIIEFLRGIFHVRDNWPGAVRLLDTALELERQARPDMNPGERCFFDCLEGVPGQGPVGVLVEAARRSVNCFHTAEIIKAVDLAELRSVYRGFGSAGIRPLGFITDFCFPVTISEPPKDGLVADLKKAANERGDDTHDRQDKHSPGSSGEEQITDEDKEDGNGVNACFVYDEWNFNEGEYYRDYCLLREVRAEPVSAVVNMTDIEEDAKKIRRVFERIKPELVHREKYLQDGDSINTDLLVEHLVQKKQEPSPVIRFYEKPLVNKRDLSLLILLDVSGSTGEELKHGSKIIEIEKQAAVILGHGLSTLGDRFAVCGFTSHGRENCEYFIFKEFGREWSPDTVSAIMSARPRNSTRIGPALRHSGYLLSGQVSRQRLIILITDGRPMDSDYDPNSRYAQHDVRMACEENARHEIHTFAISTEENSLADMEIMFPHKRFAILPDICDLPRVLPQLYIRLTV